MTTDNEKLAEMIGEARKIVVFTGAGISTESGIPDFRSPGGLWTKYKPIEFSDFISSVEKRRESWQMKFASEKVMKSAKPNKGHQAVAELLTLGKLSCVITQNVDGLHQLSGIPDEKVIELHGNATYAKCLDCGKRYEMAEIKELFLKEENPPNCDACGGIIKSATISFGQSMPVNEMQEAEQETLSCDLFIAIGSSLVVYPAAGFPQIAKQNGSKLVIINRDETGLDEYADLVLNMEIGDTLSAAVGKIENR
jgi:NAD-dependent protein deacetylase/lipoamidase